MMSRYLLQLARETHSPLKPPSNLRIAPRAVVTYDGVHQERIVAPAPMPPAAIAAPPPNVTAPRPADPVKPTVWNPEIATRIVPELKSPPVKRSAAPPRVLRTETSRPSLEMREPALVASPVNDRPGHPKREPVSRPVTPAPPREPRMAPETPAPYSRRDAVVDPGREIVESTVLLESFAFDPPPPQQTNAAPFSIPEPVRTWLRSEPAPSAPRKAQLPRPLVPSFEPARADSTVIDVTIGKVEVTIESDAPAPLRAARRSEPRNISPKSSAPIPGRLTRGYLDR